MEIILNFLISCIVDSACVGCGQWTVGSGQWAYNRHILHKNELAWDLPQDAANGKPIILTY